MANKNQKKSWWFYDIKTLTLNKRNEYKIKNPIKCGLSQLFKSFEYLMYQDYYKFSLAWLFRSKEKVLAGNLF